MRLRVFFAFFFFGACAFTQAQEANSLLWEISGNGLEKSSYLYGTMHVSKKIAFRLDDVFYEALQKSEKIALESDPSTWLESDVEMGNMGYSQRNGFVAKGFYTYPFKIKNPRKEEIASFLAFEDRMVNNILYRTNEYSQNFEEETYLDMFIYQAGSKFSKPIIALENLEESTALVGRASMNAVKQKPDEWLQKKMQRQDLMFLMQDAYRERNINLLDSIDQAMYTDHYLKNMLYIRNENMVHSLDSVMKTAKIFAGIGAAHLPGKNGVIELLRKKGYVVKPLVSESTERGQQLKNLFETKYKTNSYSVQRPDDGFFSISLPNKLYAVSEHINTTYISPDLTNGSYLMVNRIPTFSFLKKDVSYSLEAIDQLLFENIPGTILEKRRVTNNGFQGLDIKNVLKNGDHQRYQIFVTPLEIFIFKMGGEGSYVKQHADIIFNSLSFRSPAGRKTTLSPAYRDFEVTMPDLYRFPNRSRNGNRFLEGYDAHSDSYFFLRKATLNDFNFIEEDSFELKQIQKRFYQDLKLTPEYNSVRNNELVSSALFNKKDNQRLYLKTVFQRGAYFLLGVLTRNPEEAQVFLNSFKLKTPWYPNAFVSVRDTALFFSSCSAVKPPKFVESSNAYYQGQKKPKTYSPYTKKTIYQNKNDEAITVELSKSHDFLSFPSIDSVWSLRKKQYVHRTFKIHSEKQLEKEGVYELQLTLTDTSSTRGILIKNVLRGGLLYEVKAVIDTLQAPSEFVQVFFENFKPEGPKVGRDILEDKTADFFTALRAKDSIVLDGYRYIFFEDHHKDSLKHYIAHFEFSDDKKHIQSHMIQKLGKMKSPDVIEFFEDLYAKSYNNSAAQTKILQALTSDADEKAAKLLLQFMSKDLPLISNKLEIHKIFKPFKDSLALAKHLYPEILDYSTIAEYKSPIFSLLAELKTQGVVKPSSYKKYRKQLLSDAKIQLKRHLGQSGNLQNLRRYYNKKSQAQSALLADYVILLYPFREEKSMKLFFERLWEASDPKIQTTYVALLAKDGLVPPTKVLNSLAADPNSRNMLFNALKEVKKTELFPSAFRTQQALAKAALFDQRKYNPRKDSLVFLEKRPIQFKGATYQGFYFKLRNNEDYDKNFKMHLVVYETKDELLTKPYFKNEGLRIEDTETDQEAMGYVTEAFLLKDRKRAMVYKPGQFDSFGYRGF